MTRVDGDIEFMAVWPLFKETHYLFLLQLSKCSQTRRTERWSFLIHRQHSRIFLGGVHSMEQHLLLAVYIIEDEDFMKSSDR